MPDAQGKPLQGEPGYASPSGLINTAAPATGQVATSTPAQAAPTAVTATPYTVAPNQTVASNVSSIIADGSPLLQQAQSRAMQKMNQRGLLNSSQAIGAGESALYDAAMPIATQDAATYNQAATNTTQAQNAASTTNAQLGTQTSLSNAQASNQVAMQNAQNATTAQTATLQSDTSKYMANLDTSTKLQMQGIDDAWKTAYQTADNQTKVQLQQMQSTTQISIAKVEADYKTLMQTSASATDVYRSAMTGIQNVVGDTSIDAAGKANVINGYLGWMKTSMSMIGSVNGVDLSGLLDFGGVSG